MQTDRGVPQRRTRDGIHQSRGSSKFDKVAKRWRERPEAQNIDRYVLQRRQSQSEAEMDSVGIDREGLVVERHESWSSAAFPGLVDEGGD